MIPAWISAERFEPYLRHGGHDPNTACELYEWAAELTSAAFEATHYVEVMLRNAIDRQLQIRRDEARAGIPWFLTPLGSDKKSSRCTRTANRCSGPNAVTGTGSRSLAVVSPSIPPVPM